VLARHHRQRGDDVFFLTGTDEHGEPVADVAEREGVPPQELADRNAARFEALWPRLGISNDFFIRTTDPRHEAKVQEVLTRVKDKGHVYEGTYDGWYCPRCAEFKTEDQIGPDNTCLIHKIPLTREREDNWFFRLSTFQEPLERLYEERPDFVMPPHRFNEARSFIASGLQDVSLTRAKLRWGVTVPWDESQVFYVWWDALLNYYTALSFGADEDVTGTFWPATFHVIGKDILRFHTIFWPALLMAAELEARPTTETTADRRWRRCRSRAGT
jgi:methionyl-tRNA synthetase